MIVSFYGSHYGMSRDELGKLNDAILNLINNGYHTFYCGTYGKFDSQVIDALKEFKKLYPFIKIIKVKPYYQANRFHSQKARRDFIKIADEIRYQNNNDEESVNRELEIEEREAESSYSDWYYREKKDFDNVFIPDYLDNFPYKYRIIECNKWKIKNSDVCVFYTRYSHKTLEFYKFAKKLNKNIVLLCDPPTI